MDVEHATTHYCGRSVALTDSQGIPDHIDAPSEQYDGIAHIIRTALAKGQHTDPDKSVLSRCKTGSPRDICGWFRPRRVRGLHSRHFEVAQNELSARRDQHRDAG